MFKIIFKPVKIFITLIVLAVIVFAVYTYRDRFWERKTQPGTDYESKFKQDQSADNQGQPANNSPASTEERLRGYLDDCHNNCTSFAGDEQKSCFAACGLSEKSETENENAKKCEDLSGVDRDECFRDRAVNQKDDSLCDQIDDDAIEEACVNAVAEEVLEGL